MSRAPTRFSYSAFRTRLTKYYGFCTLGFILFAVALGLLEYAGLSRPWIGYAFLVGTIGLYAAIGIKNRTAEVAEYYVAGRRVPAVFNGMASGAGSLGVAAFIGLAGALYLSGFDGLAFVMGWAGGYCLVAVFVAPYLRKFGQFTIPDFLAARYGGNVIRTIGILAAIACSFVFVIAQIYAVGLITSRLTGFEFGVGVLVGVVAILACSMLGGMKAVTWAQVAQYIVIVIAYLTPVVWLGVKQTGNPVPQVTYGQTLQQLAEVEKKILADPAEAAVRQIYGDRAATAVAAEKNPVKAHATRRAELEKEITALRASNGPPARIDALQKMLTEYPSDVERWRAVAMRDKALAPRALPPRPHAEPYAAKDEQNRDTARWNFLAIVFCMMLGTAALPHILVRYSTTPNVQQARQSVFWSLFFLFLLLFTAPCLVVLAKYALYTKLVGSSFAALPAWTTAWSAVDPGLFSIRDTNGDGIVQLAEIVIGGDLIALAMPEIAGLPYVVSGLVAAGALAAALAGASSLVLTISNALSHDLYYRMIDPAATPKRRLLVSKVLFALVAIVAAYVTALKPADILFLVGAAFSLAASAFFAPLVLGVFWKRATQWGAIAGVIAGLGICLYYIARTYPAFINMGVPKMDLWFGLNPIAAGVFGVPLGLATIVIVSLLTSEPDKETQELVDHVRYPRLRGDIVTEAK